MTLLAVTADTWIITGLGFGIVLLLLFFLVFVLMGFGWIMQKATTPAAPSPNNGKSSLRQEGQTSAASNDTAAIAMALYLASQQAKRDENITMIPPQTRNTAWNEKAIGLNNVGF